MASLTVLAGPTAVGKGAVVAALLRKYPNVYLSVSATTRPARPGEVDGVHYHFLTDAQFDQLVCNNGLLEWALVHGQYRYGTPKAAVEAHLATGQPVLVEIDLAGVRQIRQTMPAAKFIFLAPPSWDELVARLRGRGTEDEAEQQRRLETAKVELAAASEFDLTIVNDEVETAVTRLAEAMGLA
ncbi:MAG: guanylate kinase [Actinomycetaceae bacterium]|nr:guanylate kinase [Actinomycetaceae bacterium]